MRESREELIAGCGGHAEVVTLTRSGGCGGVGRRVTPDAGDMDPDQLRMNAEDKRSASRRIGESGLETRTVYQCSAIGRYDAVATYRDQTSPHRIEAIKRLEWLPRRTSCRLLFATRRASSSARRFLLHPFINGLMSRARNKGCECSRRETLSFALKRVLRRYGVGWRMASVYKYSLTGTAGELNPETVVDGCLNYWVHSKLPNVAATAASRSLLLTALRLDI